MPTSTSTAGPEADVANVLSSWPSVLSSVDVSGWSTEEVERALSQGRLVQRCLDGLIARLGARLDQLAGDGRSATARDVLRGSGTVGSRQADRDARRSETAAAIPSLGRALSIGAISGEHVDTVGRYHRRLDDDERDQLDLDQVSRQAERLPPETFDRWMRRHVDAMKGDHGLSEAVARRDSSEFRHWFDERSGMGRFAGTLDAERYETLCNRIEHRMTTLAAEADEPTSKNAALAAEALVDLIAGDGSGRSGIPSITVIVDERTLRSGPHTESIRQTENGHDLPPETVARLCCDATLRRIVLDRRGLPIDVGRRHRTATDAQWAVLKALYTCCAWGSCSAPIAWCQAHHILEWEHGGPTDLDNLVPLCTRHHHLVHEGRWRVRLLDDRTLRINRPDGGHHADVPPVGRSPGSLDPPPAAPSLVASRVAPADRLIRGRPGCEAT